MCNDCVGNRKKKREKMERKRRRKMVSQRCCFTARRNLNHFLYGYTTIMLNACYC